MRIIGHRKERPMTFSASAELLVEGARFNEEFQKLPMGRLTAIPKGVYRFKTHAQLNRYDEACLAARMAQISRGRA